MPGEELTALTQVIIELKGQIERMAERQDEMLDDVKKIKQAVYDPDSGIYARLRILEQWKETTSKNTMGDDYELNKSLYRRSL